MELYLKSPIHLYGIELKHILPFKSLSEILKMLFDLKKYNGIPSKNTSADKFLFYCTWRYFVEYSSHTEIYYCVSFCTICIIFDKTDKIFILFTIL